MINITMMGPSLDPLLSRSSSIQVLMTILLTRTCITFVKILYSPETDRDTSLSWPQVHNNDKNHDIINGVKNEKKLQSNYIA